MKKENKVQIIDKIAAQIEEIPNFYITDIEGLNAEATSKLRRACYKNDIKLVVVKNTLFQKALEKRGIEGVDKIEDILKGSSAIMFSQKGNAPAKLIQKKKK